ncbi:hypothetical protein Q3V23_17465 [Streptomyces sp. VNUA116]|uniref:hypothetical protein n=1 Tax=Streptomyces sp. VNUA116 TaxID=3062449 RepID=UPI002674FF62|nr:hypothetical protein [Streptomyces sp. VNUA116]WKU45697.1 hypothetical protein Q3V23_17465 [Streptomyces sp. VNUA116]
MTDLADGGWQGDEAKSEQHLKLSAEDNRTVTQFWERAAAARGELDNTMKGLETQSAARGGKLEGLQYSLKGLDSLRRKVAVPTQRGASAEDVCAEVDDLNRYTLTFETDNYVQGAKETYERLREQGYEPLSESNTWQDPVYKGLNTTWQHTEREERFELQFHTPESFAAKSENHELYELARGGSFDQKNTKEQPNRSTAYYQASDLLQNERYANVRIPEGVDELGKVKVRATLNPQVSPEVVAEVRQMEADLKATHAEAAARARAEAEAKSVGLEMDDPLQSEKQDLKNRLAANASTPESTRKAAEAPYRDPVPRQSHSRGPSLT